ncbi:hypothetical protein [Campylobacter sp. VTCC 70190]|uniref:hypothetical protein n=1 Tax=Campylobacter sp. VTCC 70190 TaxID=3392118 RepID=UPI00398F53EB
MFLLQTLSVFSVFFEILALALAFYFKHTRIFFLTLSLFIFHMPYLYTSTLQAHLFVFLFLPLIFFLLSVKQMGKLIVEQKNLSSVILLIFIAFLSFFLSKNTAFNSANLSFHFLSFSFFKPLSELGFLFFIFMGAVLIIKAFKSKEFYLFLAFLGANLQFLFESFWGFAYFELASLIFCIFLIYRAYQITFFDTLTKLPNEKNLHRFIKGRASYTIALLHFNEFKDTQESYSKLILKQIAKILKRFKAKIFIVEKDFILIFDDKNTALNHLAFLESTLKNTDFKLENEVFKPEFKLLWKEKEGNLNQNLQSLRAKL